MKWTDEEILAAAEWMRLNPDGEGLLLLRAEWPVAVCRVELHRVFAHWYGTSKLSYSSWLEPGELTPTPAGEAWLAARRAGLSATEPASVNDSDVARVTVEFDRCGSCNGSGMVGDPHHGHAMKCERCGGRGVRSMKGDWPGDFSHENGNYLNQCSVCKNRFYGHKRRTCCKECAVKVTVPVPPPADSTIAPTPTNSRPTDSPITQLRNEMADLKQDIREVGARLHELADLLLRAGK